MSTYEDKHVKAAFQSVQDFYGTPESVSQYAKVARENGLYPPELAMVESFMAPPATVLDVGCGAGREAFALTRMGFSVTGVDITASLVAQARALAADFGLNIPFHLGDGVSLDFAPESFDYVTLITQMIHHVPLRPNRERLFREAARVLKMEGTILLTYHDFDVQKDHQPWGWKKGRQRRACEPESLPDTLRLLESGDYFTGDCQGHATAALGFGHCFTRREMEEEVVAAGLRIVDKAGFETIAGGTPDTFWKPTQILVLKKT
ncbi:MAG: class I SAM-dependent methyltransferase [Phycisphaerae bacterium]|jgi:ubiquinone/menaquinone biosynthesis C-methylase UbiE